MIRCHSASHYTTLHRYRSLLLTAQTLVTASRSSFQSNNKLKIFLEKKKEEQFARIQRRKVSPAVSGSFAIFPACRGQMSITALKNQWERRPIFSLAPRARQSVQSRSDVQSPSISIDRSVRRTTLYRLTSDIRSESYICFPIAKYIA